MLSSSKRILAWAIAYFDFGSLKGRKQKILLANKEEPSGVAIDLSVLFQPSNFDLIICCVDDPNTLAKDACEAGLLSQEMMAMLTGNFSMNGEAKTRSMLEYMVGVVSLRPHHSRNLLAVLQKQPNVKNLLIALQIPDESIKEHLARSKLKL